MSNSLSKQIIRAVQSRAAKTRNEERDAPKKGAPRKVKK